ncbi:MAG: hypothetical protein ACR2PO_16355, partial [Methyloligellaceae bacterium]
MDEILASIRRIIADDEADGGEKDDASAPPEPNSTASPAPNLADDIAKALNKGGETLAEDPDKPKEEDILELTEALVAAPTEPAMETAEAPAATAGFDAEPSPVDAEMSPEPLQPAQTVEAEPTPVAKAEPAESIVPQDAGLDPAAPDAGLDPAAPGADTEAGMTDFGVSEDFGASKSVEPEALPTIDSLETEALPTIDSLETEALPTIDEPTGVSIPVEPALDA